MQYIFKKDKLNLINSNLVLSNKIIQFLKDISKQVLKDNFYQQRHLENILTNQ